VFHVDRLQGGGLMLLLAILLIQSTLPGSPAAGATLAWSSKVTDQVAAATAEGPAEFLVLLREQADLSPAEALPTKEMRGAYVYRNLTELAARTQPAVVAILEKAGAPHRSFWIVNALWTRGDAQLVEELARDPAVGLLEANPAVRLAPEGPSQLLPGNSAEKTPNWNIALAQAPAVWAEGYRGEGVVVGGIDTGVDWEHPALKEQYQGWYGTGVDHDHSWHDAIHSGGGVCGPDSPQPCDDHSHGTYTMGIMVGEAPGHQIGMAPGARWIACRCMDQGVGTPASYIECLEWMVAPSDVDGSDPRPDLAPDVINNSWVCTEAEGCTDPNAILLAVQHVRLAGVAVVASAGNAGPDCSTVHDPPAIYDDSFSIGATDSLDAIASFSSRGPVLVDGSDRLKPDLAAPGVRITSCIPDSGYRRSSGTSAAAPHVAGAIALVCSLDPWLKGDVGRIESLLRQTALPLISDQDCGGFSGGGVPNAVFGYGRLQAYAAWQLALSQVVGVPDDGSPGGSLAPAVHLLRIAPNPANPAVEIAYELSSDGPVELVILDARGRRIRTLLGTAYQTAGSHAVRWNGRDDAGRPAASGVYFCRLGSRDEHAGGRFLLLR
jgi:serine protease AprX